GQHTGSLLDQRRWRADGKRGWQVYLGEPEGLAWSLSRKCSRQRRDQVVLMGERLAQRRQSRSRLRQRGFLQSDVIAIGKSGVELTPDGFEHLLIDRNDLFGRFDLPAQRSFSDYRNNKIGGERQVGGFSLEALHVGQGVERFHRAPVEPPDVERLRDFN